MNVIKEINAINQREISQNLAGEKWDVNSSWHAKYNDSAYVFVGGLPFDLTEGDAIVVFSQYGEIIDCNLIRDRKTGKSRGFAFVAYENQQSTVLAVDNLNGTKLCGRSLRVDHVSKYKKQKRDIEEGREPGEAAEEESEDEGISEYQKWQIENNKDKFAEVQQKMDEKVTKHMQERDRERETVRKQEERTEAILSRKRRDRDVRLKDEAERDREREEYRKRKQEEIEALHMGKKPEGPKVAMPVNESKWERFMSGEGTEDKKKKKKKKEKKEKDHSNLFKKPKNAPEPEKERKRMGEVSMSVQESNAMREKLGLKPLKN